MRRDEAYLLDILLAARRAIKYVENVSRARFEEEEMIQDAVSRTLEIIGETEVTSPFGTSHSARMIQVPR